MQVSTCTRKTLYMVLFKVLSRVSKNLEMILMNRAGLIQGLILLLVVSLAIAGVYASEAGEVSHDDATDNSSGLYVSGSGDVAHVSGYSDSFGEVPHIESVISDI